MQSGASVSELRRSQQQYNSYVAALGAETVDRSGLVRQLRDMLTQQVSPLPETTPCSCCMLLMLHLSVLQFFSVVVQLKWVAPHNSRP